MIEVCDSTGECLKSDLEREIKRLRALVKTAYKDGFEDCQHGYTKTYANIVDQQNTLTPEEISRMAIDEWRTKNR